MRRFAVVALSVVVAFILVAMALPLFMRVRDGKPNICLSHVKNLTIATQMYMADYPGTVPDPDRWCDALQEYVRDEAVFVCNKNTGARCSYAFNLALDGMDPRALPGTPQMVALFESDRGWNAHGTMDLLPDRPRHRGGDHYGFLDGSAKWIVRNEAASLMWHPVAARAPNADVR